MRPSTSIVTKRPLSVVARRSTTNLDTRHQPKSRYLYHSRNSFGSDAPAFTIGSSRKEAKTTSNESPAPCDYNVPRDSCAHSQTHVIQSRQWTEFKTITSDIDYIDLRQFPKIGKRTIGKITCRSLLDPRPETPAPSYFPDDIQPKDYYKKHIIVNKPKQNTRDSSPGPQDYSPTDATRPSVVYHSIPRAPVKRFNDNMDNDVPGPGTYNVTPEIKRAGRWTERLRVKPKRFDEKNNIKIDCEQ